VNGREVGAPEYELKLHWLDALTSWLRSTYQAASPLLVIGDFNVAPDDRDVYDPDR
jgi:exodeoxyribonuclease III